jgi:hypothetical protein
VKLCTGEDIPSENKSFELDDLQTPLRQDYVMSRRNYLSEAQEKSVIALIQEIQPESTAFVAVMRKSHVEPPQPCLVRSQLDPVGWQLTYLDINLLLIADCVLLSIYPPNISGECSHHQVLRNLPNTC